MAHRSHLYAADSLPTKDDTPRPVRSVSDHNWSIPLAQLLLVGHGTTVVPSMMWDPPMCVAADYAEGADLLLALLRLVGEGEVPDREDFDDLVALIARHLDEQKSRYFLLEAGEIFDLREADLDTAARELIRYEIEPAAARARAALGGGETAWLEEIRREWPTHFVSFYVSHLSYSFPD
jgi:hypothetical protein